LKYFLELSKSNRKDAGNQLPLHLLEHKHGADGTAFVTKFLRSKEGFHLLSESGWLQDKIQA
jgi:hypothetical protein